MTADPIRILIDDRPSTAGFAGASPLAPKPIPATDLASLRSAEPPFDINPPVSSPTAALVRRQSAPSKAPPGARPIAKSP